MLPPTALKLCEYKSSLEAVCMNIEAAKKYYIANKQVRHKSLGLMLIVNLYPSRLDSVRVKTAKGIEMDCQLEFLDPV